MSTPPYGDYRNGSAAAHDPIEDKMQQIRELLFGEFKRDSDARLALIDARVRELETGLHRRLDQIQAKLDAMALDAATDRKRAFDELAQSVGDLGERIRQIGRH